MRSWGKALLEDPKGATKVRKALKYRADRARGAKREKILKEFNYVTNFLKRMNHADLRRRGRAVGSGPQEATCKTLISILAVEYLGWTLIDPVLYKNRIFPRSYFCTGWGAWNLKSERG